VQAFLAASREGDFEGLLAVLSPSVVLHADSLAVRMAKAKQGQGAPSLARVIRGRTRVANTFTGRAAAALPAIIDGEAGAVWMTEGQMRLAFVFSFEGDRIIGINLVMEQDRLAKLDVQTG
jgi:RNA polymerase sigma-70 factor (ECF subfamily)